MKLLASASLLATLTLSPLGWANPVPNPMAPVPEIAGKAYLLTDFYSNQVLASRDPLQDNAQALELEAELEQEIDKDTRSSPAAGDGGRDGSGPQARNSNR